MEDYYSVSSRRVTTAWFGTKRFYVPVVHDQLTGKPSAMKDIGEMPTVWGYETEDEAWVIIDDKIREDRMLSCDDESDYRCRDSGREDFHADG